MSNDLRALRHVMPVSFEGVRNRIACYTGIRLADVSVCPGHMSPAHIVADQLINEPPVSLKHGPRGGGKSFGQAIVSHHRCRFRPHYGVRILGGSLAQSEQVYNAVRDGIWSSHGPLGSDFDTFGSLLKTRATYRNGSDMQILAASRTSARGPHVPNLVLDEVDEIDPEIREAALGMCMNKNGYKAVVDLLSTWHKVGGPMTTLIEQGDSGAFPVYRFCVFEVLERCPASRSGPRVDGPDLYANCPSCPIKRWCHEHVANGLPKAKRSNGHYSIDSLIQKTAAGSTRLFESDYLCRGPRAAGIWFTEFDRALNVSDLVARDPRTALHLAIDSGVHTGAVFFQVVKTVGRRGTVEEQVQVIDEYYAVETPAERVGREVREMARSRFGDVIHHGSTDSAGSARNPVGPRVLEEYQRGGLGPLRPWPKYDGCVNDGLALVESFVTNAQGSRGLVIHPRCKRTIQAFENYRRKQLRGEWLDEPQDPQHPHEEFIDALRGGLMLAFPQGRSGLADFRRSTPHAFV